MDKIIISFQLNVKKCSVDWEKLKRGLFLSYTLYKRTRGGTLSNFSQGCQRYLGIADDHRTCDRYYTVKVSIGTFESILLYMR